MADSKTPAKKTPSTSRKQSSVSSSATGKQQSILGFFGKSQTSSPLPSSPCLQETAKSTTNRKPSSITPVPSSDAVEPSSSQENQGSAATLKVSRNDVLPTPVTPAETVTKQSKKKPAIAMDSSPIRKVAFSLFFFPCLYFFHFCFPNYFADTSFSRSKRLSTTRNPTRRATRTSSPP